MGKNQLYELLPYVVLSKDFIACHAAPPTSKASFSDLVNISKNPSLINELINTRLRKLDEGHFDAIILAAAGLKKLADRKAELAREENEEK